jgi:large subunit ribosomal protein LX
MKAFRIEGEFLMGDKWQKFRKEVASVDESTALECLVSDMGGRHRAKRKNIKVSTVTKLKLEEIEDPLVRDEVEGEKSGK